MNLVKIFLFFFCSISVSFSQNIEWLSHHNWNSGGNVAEMATDSESNVFCIGSSEGGKPIGNIGKTNKDGFIGGKYAGEIKFGTHGLSGDGTFVTKISIENLTNAKPYKIEEGSLFIYPNPSYNFINIQYNPTANNSIISIYNMAGGLVYYQTTTNNRRIDKTVDVSSLSPGIYFINLTSGVDRRTKKFIINR